MFTFTLGLILTIAAIAVFALCKYVHFPRYITYGLGGLLLIIGLITTTISTAIHVGDDSAGIVVNNFGADLPADRIIATNGEKGPQAYTLSQGWHFGFMPWKYNLESVPFITIPEGSIGEVNANDGKPLPKGETYAPEWSSYLEMLDGEKFLNGEGYKGAQLTVLPPGQYRYNPRLFTIELKPATEVKIGEVVVVKDNAGKVYDGPDVEMVNGTALVPKGHRGTWNEALSPGLYYMHTKAYQLTHVKTTNRVYSYTGSESNEQRSAADRPTDSHSINVRTKDGFEFPIDVRVACSISAKNAPYITARIGAPDEDLNRDGFDNLEDIVILPATRAVLRNGSESHNGLEYVNTRSTIETQATVLVLEQAKDYRVDIEGVYIADIGLSDTPQGEELLKTQTDREVAKQEQATWLEKKLAAESRAQSVRAEAEATQEEQLVSAEVQIKVAESESKAEIARAQGKSEAARMQIEALGGQENYIQLKLAELLSEKWTGSIPQVMVVGEGELDTAVLGNILKEQVNNE